MKDGYFDVWLPTLDLAKLIRLFSDGQDFDDPASRMNFYDACERGFLSRATGRTQTVEFSRLGWARAAAHQHNDQCSQPNSTVVVSTRGSPVGHYHPTLLSCRLQFIYPPNIGVPVRSSLLSQSATRLSLLSNQRLQPIQLINVLGRYFFNQNQKNFECGEYGVR